MAASCRSNTTVVRRRDCLRHQYQISTNNSGGTDVEVETPEGLAVAVRGRLLYRLFIGIL